MCQVESRSKPGAYFYAHPATKRTQMEHPAETQRQVAKPVAAAVAEGPKRPKKEGAALTVAQSSLEV